MSQLSAVGTPDAPPIKDGLPLRVERDRTLRVKIIDACGMACTFCHNEGTPVVADNLNVPRSAAMTGRGRSGRVSIYLADNGARFLPAAVSPDEEFAAVLARLRDVLDLNELHLTGGEPSLHPRLAHIVAAGRDAGFRVCMTSNGENAARIIPDCARAGLDRVNFSIFGTTAAELAQVQHHKFADIERASKKVLALRNSVQVTLDHGVGASANIVVPDYTHASRVHRLINEWAPELSVRLLNSLDEGIVSIDAIEHILDDLAAVPLAHHVTAGASGWRTSYQLPDGRVLWFKRIRPVRLPKTCAGCRFNNGKDCHEGYYGVRLYRDRSGGFQVGVCIQRMDLCLPVAQFLSSPLPQEIIDLRSEEYVHLSPISA
ncbi:radical SAM protein [Nocardia nepalensis]|uniref:radical SAM protein n=1 Tax=Nocardia nepalensis TaxID=3375448 RepID=UPI003B6747C4